MSYREIIHAAVPDAPTGDLQEIEEIMRGDIMRGDIFHSTLDWQTRAQLRRAARQAWQILLELRSYRATREV